MEGSLKYFGKAGEGVLAPYSHIVFHFLSSETFTAVLEAATGEIDCRSFRKSRKRRRMSRVIQSDDSAGKRHIFQINEILPGK